MVPLRRLNRHRSAIATAVAVAAVVAVVGGVAITSGGYTAQRIDLGDAAVWVPNDGMQSIGRASTAALELNSLVETGGGRVEVAQSGPTVLMLDPDRASVDIIDVTTSSVIEQPVAVPPDQPTVTLAGAKVVVVSQGDVWTSSVDDFVDFDADAEPELVVRGRSPDLGRPRRQAVRVHADDRCGPGGRHRRHRHGRPHLGDRSHHRWPRAAAQLGRRRLGGARRRCARADVRLVARSTSPTSSPKATARCSRSPSAAGDEIVIAHRQGLVSVGLDDGATRKLVDDRSGTAVAPVVHEGCIHAVWGRGTAWRSCASGDRLFQLDVAAGTVDFEFMQNGSALALNERNSGRTWAASADYELIDNWEDLRELQNDEEKVEQNNPDEPPIVEKSQFPPVALDDVEFGARPDRSTLLPVILNDYDANGDVLVIDSIVGELPSWATVDLVSDNQQLQLTLEPEAFGSVAFDYVVSDGRGGSAQAHVEVTVRATDENSPPRQERETKSARRHRRARDDGGARRLGRSRWRPVLPAAGDDRCRPLGLLDRRGRRGRRRGRRAGRQSHGLAARLRRSRSGVGHARGRRSASPATCP